MQPRRIWLSAGLMVPVAFVVGWLLWIQLVDPWYTSRVSVHCSPAQIPPQSLGFGPVLDNADIERFVSHAMRKSLAAETLRNAVNWPSVFNTGWFVSLGGDEQAAVADLSRKLVARRIPDSTMFEIELALPGPTDAQIVLDALLTVHLNRQASDVAAAQHVLFAQYLTAERELDALVEHLNLIAASTANPSSRLGPAAERKKSLELLAAEFDDAWSRLSEARKALGASGARFPSRNEMTHITRAVPPAEARRVWWRWPWN